MFIVNGGIFLVGAALLGIGIWVQVDSGSLLGFLDHIENAPPELRQLTNVGYLLIGIGAGLGLIGFLGCCGAVKESRCMLLTFFSIVLIIFIAEVAGAILLFVFEPAVRDVFERVGEKVATSIQNDYDSNPSVATFWNSTMKLFDCCGYNNYTDFTGSPYNRETNLYPPECCSSVFNGNCTGDAAHTSNITGCFERIVTLVEENAIVVGGVALGICAVEIAAMVVSMVLYCKAGK